jgi:hypothetical protein
MDTIASLPKSKLYAVLDEFGLGFLFHMDEPEFESSRGWEETKWIVLSSSFFCIPGILRFINIFSIKKPEYELNDSPVPEEIQFPTLVPRSGISQFTYIFSLLSKIPGIPEKTECTEEYFYTQINIFSAILILTSLVSANYWRDAKKGWRRNADLVLAKITFSSGVYYSVQYITDTPILIAIFSLFPFLFHCYSQSSALVHQQNREWVKYHFAFHILLAVGSVLTLRGMELSDSRNVFVPHKCS